MAPSGKVLEEIVDSVSLPGSEGAFEIYSRHTPLIAALKAGKVRVRFANQESTYEITSGILEVDLEHNCILLADQAQLI